MVAADDDDDDDVEFDGLLDDMLLSFERRASIFESIYIYIYEREMRTTTTTVSRQ